MASRCSMPCAWSSTGASTCAPTPTSRIPNQLPRRRRRGQRAGSLRGYQQGERQVSHFLDRLKFFNRVQDTFSNGHGIVTNEDRSWEDAYRNRWRHDKVVRSTHGVNCTGGCSWKIFVKNGLVSF